MGERESQKLLYKENCMFGKSEVRLRIISKDNKIKGIKKVPYFKKHL